VVALVAAVVACALASSCAVAVVGVVAFSGVMTLALTPTGLVLAVTLRKLTGDVGDAGSAGAITWLAPPREATPEPPVGVEPEEAGL
jgi:hypothetical protein